MVAVSSPQHSAMHWAEDLKAKLQTKKELREANMQASGTCKGVVVAGRKRDPLRWWLWGWGEVGTTFCGDVVTLGVPPFFYFRNAREAF